MKQPASPDSETVYAYHDQTKHHPRRYARSLGYMDWDSQPDPFRLYRDATVLPLDHPQETSTPTYDSLFISPPRQAARIDRDSISRLFYESLAISAWKQAGGNRWSLRVNPSSGDLHPTEAYLIAGPVLDLHEKPGIFHYSPYLHALEHRAGLTPGEWTGICRDMEQEVLFVALSSIFWREAWKYGERAYRYCHHDVGHAIAAVTVAAAALGWRTRIMHAVTDEELAALLGLPQGEGPETEHPDCLLEVFPGAGSGSPEPDLVNPLIVPARLERSVFEGVPNTLSNTHQEWPVIDGIAAACRTTAGHPLHVPPAVMREAERLPLPDADRLVPARRIIRERRSAVSMDGRTAISRETFYVMMSHVTHSRNNGIVHALSMPAQISLAILVHRVEGLPPGLYVLVRHPDHEASLRKSLRPVFHWTKPEDCPQTISLHLLSEFDARDIAGSICCHQSIAADGAFALGMLASFDASLERFGPPIYPRLFWEAGLIGQILYLEAEAAGIRATGIGCYFDDVMHEVLGITDHSWQSLYHFTVGGAVDDPRIQTLSSYWHLGDEYTRSG